MDQLFEVFFSPQTLLVCLGVYAITTMLRRMIETPRPDLRQNKYYSKLALPCMPLVIGMGLGYFLKDFGWPEMIRTSAGGRVLFGLICGLLSAGAYNRIREWLRVKGGKGGGDSLPPISNSFPPSDGS